MLKKLILLVIVSSFVLFTACTPKHSEIIVAEFGDHEVKMDEFEKAYAKNAGSLEEAKKDSLHQYKNFLDLYVNFKMKLSNAVVRDLPNDAKILSELKEYERTIGTSFLLEKELYEKGVKDLFDKRSEEIRVSHILIRTDTISADKAEKKAMDIIERIKNGSSFEVEARKYSEDQFSKKNGGDIYYITAGMIMPEFEDIAYSTPVGEVNPTPLKTKYGYHVIKVTDRKKRIPSIRASHILIRNESNEENIKAKNRAKIEEILTRVKNGEDFGTLAAEFSDDPGSKQNKGDLGYFSRRQMVQPFDEAVFNLEIGEVSDIVETQFGYHIIKLTDKQANQTFDSEKKKLRDTYEKIRKQVDYDKLIEKYASEFNYVKNEKSVENINNALAEISLDGTYWNSKFHDDYGSYNIFKLNGVEYNLDSMMYSFLNDPQMMGRTLAASNFNEYFDEFKSKKVFERKAAELINQDSEFASLMEEYKNGILIFRLQEDEVWKKIKMDSIAIYNLYEETKENYVLNDRVKFEEVYSKNDSVMKAFYAQLLEGQEFDSARTEMNLSVKNQSNEFVEAQSNDLAKAAFDLKNEGDFSEMIKSSKGWSVVKLIKKEPSRIKTFDEAKAEVTSVYQDMESTRLENTYIKSLKDIYKPELFYEELENTYKN